MERESARERTKKRRKEGPEGEDLGEGAEPFCKLGMVIGFEYCSDALDVGDDKLERAAVVLGAVISAGSSLRHLRRCCSELVTDELEGIVMVGRFFLEGAVA